MRNLSFWLIMLGSGWGQDDRLPVPSDDHQAQAEKTIRAVFKDEYATKSSTAQQKLAKKLLQQGMESKDDPNVRFVLFREAADLAGRSADLETLLQSLEALCSGYQVDAPWFKESYLAKAEPGIAKPDDLKRLTEAYFQLSQEAIQQDQLDMAAKSAQSSLTAAKKSKDMGLAVRADALVKSVSEARSSLEKAKKAEAVLAQMPDDPAANLALGEYICLSKGQWEKGLKHLSKGSDVTLKALATKEMAAPSEVAPLVELADGWWDLAEQEKGPVRKSQLSAHARTLYKQALPSTAGLVRMKVEKRSVAPGTADAPKTGNVRANREGLVAWWKLDEGKGTTTANSVGAGVEGTLENGVEWTKGRLGNALKLEAASSYVSLKVEGLPAIEAAKSITCWFQFSAAPFHGANLICMTDGGPNVGVQMGFKEGKIAVWRHGGTIFVAAPQPKLNAWHHCAYVFDGKRHALYVDGKSTDTSEIPFQTGIVKKFELGRYWAEKVPSHFVGLLDDVRVYNRAITDSEVQSIAAGND